jgi:hypothetical protein
MVVQVVNTGNDLGNDQFDLAIPGGGQGDAQGYVNIRYPGSTSADEYPDAPKNSGAVTSGVIHTAELRIVKTATHFPIL